MVLADMDRGGGVIMEVMVLEAMVSEGHIPITPILLRSLRRRQCIFSSNNRQWCNRRHSHNSQKSIIGIIVEIRKDTIRT